MAQKSTPEVTPLQARVQQASKVIKITEEQAWECLEELGIEKEDEDGIALLEAETTKENDAKEVFKKYAKPARFAAGWRILKGKTEKQKTDNPSMTDVIQTFRPIHTYKDRELLEQYGPEASSEIIDELLKRSHGRPFIIYKEDGETIDLHNSVLMLRTARRHETKQYHVLLRDSGSTEQVRLYRADEFPKMWLEECPIHHGTILTDGYCDKCNNTWKGIHDSKRVIVRVACDLGVKYDLRGIHELMKALRECGSIEEHPIMDIPKVALRLKELQEEDNMPKLKKRLSASSMGKQDPLFQHKTY
jgi:hypothetical protein